MSSHSFFGKTKFSVYLVYFSIFYGLFCWGKIFGKVEKSYNFEWNETAEAFVLDGDAFPTLHLFEHCYYLFHASGEVLSITEQNDSVYGGSDLFQNSICGVGEYILFNPDESTPRLLKYQNLQNSSNYGEIVIQSFEEKAFLKLPDSEAGAKFGSELTITQDLSIFSSATGYNNNEGLIVKFNQDSEGNYSFEKTISSPIAGPVFWGSSLSVDQNSSSLLIGIANTNNYQGALYKYSLPGSGLTKVSEGIGAGSMYGWSTLAEFGKIFSGSLSVLDSEGGYVSVFESSSPSLNLQTLRAPLGQFGNEFGYEIAYFDNILLVGCPGEDDLIREDAGSVYVYKLEDEFAYKHKIIPSVRNEGDRFGHTLSINQDFIFVGAPNGDGLSPNTGVVYVYEYNSPENLMVEEVFKISPPNQDFGIKFGMNLLVQGDFVFISSLRSDDTGTIYVYKKSINNTSWKHVRTLPLGDFSNHLLFPENVSLASNMGILAIGLENESSINVDSGAVQVLYNPAWDSSSIPLLPPYFENNDILVVNAMEDQSFPVVVDFNASNHPMYPNPVYWEVNSTDSTISTENYEINSTTGNFTFHLPTNLHGQVPFEISVQNGSNTFIHSLIVDINSQSDAPILIFGDQNSTFERNYTLPSASVGESYNFIFETVNYDGEEENLTLEIGQNTSLPQGLSLQGNEIHGVPEQTGTYSFSLTLSNESNSTNVDFNLIVNSSNSPPIFKFNGTVFNDQDTVNLYFNENFSLNDWTQGIYDINISDPDADQKVSISVQSQSIYGRLHCNHGKQSVITASSIKYFPEFNFNGKDFFTLVFYDDHPQNPKSVTIHFVVNINPINSAPYLLSSPPDPYAEEGILYKHTFKVFDAEGDSISLHFDNLPPWLSFDNVRTIFGKPTIRDYKSTGDTFFLTISDGNGGIFKKSFTITLKPQKIPPQITYLEENASVIQINLSEDTNSTIILEAQYTEPSSSNLMWQFLESPSFGMAEIENDEISDSKISLSYKPDDNFTGIDQLKISVFDTINDKLRDFIEIHFEISDIPDSPYIGTPSDKIGLLIDKPWEYELKLLDGDLYDNLNLSFIVCPDWIHFSETKPRVWTLKGYPSSTNVQVGQEFEVKMSLTDNFHEPTTQSIFLKIINEVKPLQLENDIPEGIINLDEDTNFTIGEINIIKNEYVPVTWSVLEMPKNGILNYEITNEGNLNNLLYLPNRNYSGDDALKLLVSDGYTSLEFDLNFEILEVTDTPTIKIFAPEHNDNAEDGFQDFNDGFTLKQEDESYDFSLMLEDGDGHEMSAVKFGHEVSGVKFLDLPDWLDVSEIDIDQYTKHFAFFGKATVDDIGEYLISVEVEKRGSDIVLNKNFKINVEFNNKPPVPSLESISAVLNEDTAKIWSNFIEAIDPEGTSLTWGYEIQPKYGQLTLEPDGSQMVYKPDDNYSGQDYFEIMVRDDNFSGYSFQKVIIPVSLDILPVNDSPVFETKPPFYDEGLQKVILSDEEDFLYEINAFDADHVSEGYPKLQILSTIPNWVQWKELENGKAVLSGSPNWTDEGNYQFSVQADSGGEKIFQNFDLEVVVYDYPPRISLEADTDYKDPIKVFIVEDDHRGEVNDIVLGLGAYNVDKEAGDGMRWVISDYPDRGGVITPHDELTVYSIGDYTYISEFQYTPSKDFYGVEKFSLEADENDRSTKVLFEINVKSVQDPPIFEDTGPLLWKFSRGETINEVISAFDPDNQMIDFKLLSPNGRTKWLSIISEFQGPSHPSVTLGGLTPNDIGIWNYSLIASDPSGRFTTLQLEIEVY